MGIDVGSVLNKAAGQKKTSKSKSKVPVVEIGELSQPLISDSAQELREEVDRLVRDGVISSDLHAAISIQGENVKGILGKWQRAHRDEKNANAQKRQAEAEILPLAEKEWIKRCREDKTFYSSMNINGAVTMTVPNRYSKIDPKHYETLEEIFGDDVDSFFKEEMEIALTPEALKDEEILRKLIKAVGEEDFARYFSVSQYLTPTEKLHHERALSAEVGEQFDDGKNKGLLKPAKSSIKNV